VVTVNIALGAGASTVVGPDATVFVIARDPAQPSPPIAAVRRRASELPAIVTLSDSDAMIPGRVPSSFAELEIIARVSMSGDPIARSGDWFGSQTHLNGSSDPLAILIDQQVP
jgi:cytochrome c-type biogenesis protein CcmH